MTQSKNFIHKETETKETVFKKYFQNYKKLSKCELLWLSSSLKDPLLMVFSISGVVKTYRKMTVVSTCIGKN